MVEVIIQRGSILPLTAPDRIVKNCSSTPPARIRRETRPRIDPEAY